MPYRAVMRALGATLALLLVPSFAQALNVEASHFTLGNGLQVVVIADRRAPVVTHMVWYLVGSADEPQGKAGIAHFLKLRLRARPHCPPRSHRDETGVGRGDWRRFIRDLAWSALGK